MDCLVPFARLCPKLAFLQVCICNVKYPDTLFFPQSQHGLQSSSLIAHPRPKLTELAHLATLVDRLFPKLVTVTIDKGMNAVLQYLQEFQAARCGCLLRTKYQ